MDPQPRPGWWKRNWKWFVPVTLVCAVVLGAAIIGLIATAVMGSIKSSVPYTRALAQAKADPTLIAEMGSPIEAGWYVTGSIRSTGQNSFADLTFPIHGPNKSGTLHVIALKSTLVQGMEDWKITVLEAKVAGRSEPIFPGAPNDGEPVRREIDVAPANPGAPGIKSGVVGGVPNASADEPPPPAPSSSRIKAPISGGVLNGRAIKLPQPIYPPIAKAAKAGGTVVVQILLDENGNVISAHAVSGHPLLKASAEAAAREARFTPTKLSGQAVKVSGVLTYNFVQQ
ncbi:MAG TPA: cytochrome c oxidase assembly factor Coa1 family protein [Pyrinomonadaceae bacterium]|jgi:protein TonB